MKDPFFDEDGWFVVSIKDSAGNHVEFRAECFAAAMAKAIQAYSPPRMFGVMADVVQTLDDDDLGALTPHIGVTMDEFVAAAKRLTFDYDQWDEQRK